MKYLVATTDKAFGFYEEERIWCFQDLDNFKSAKRFDTLEEAKEILGTCTKLGGGITITYTEIYTEQHELKKLEMAVVSPSNPPLNWDEDLDWYLEYLNNTAYSEPKVDGEEYGEYLIFDLENGHPVTSVFVDEFGEITKVYTVGTLKSAKSYDGNVVFLLCNELNKKYTWARYTVIEVVKQHYIKYKLVSLVR